MSQPGKVFSSPQADFVVFIVDQMSVNININMLYDLYISSTMAMRIIKSIMAREIFQSILSVKNVLWEREFWTSGFYISTVGRNGNEETIQNYVENQDQNDKYVQLHKAQLRLFEGF